MIKLIVSLGILLMTAVFKVAGKLRLTIPVLYVFTAAISSMFTDWVSQNELLIMIGLYIQLAIVAGSWMITLFQQIQEVRTAKHDEDDVAWQIRRARELGVPLSNVRLDSSNNLIDPRTGMPVNFSAGN